MTTKVKDIMMVLDEIAPPHLAFEGDKIGLHIGHKEADVNRIMITLDVLENVVDEAIEKKIDLIIAHHPLIFKPMTAIHFGDEKGRIVEKLIKHDISVYVAHTNLDIAVGGVNDMLMDQLGIKERDVLIETETEKLFKFVVFVPLTHENEMRHALAEAGAGHIGNYSHCTFYSKGMGSFKPLDGTNPYIGQKNQLEKVNEIRMETIVPEKLLTETIQRAKEAHPYEEMAYDIYSIHLSGDAYGLGRLGELSETMLLADFSEYVKKTFNVTHLRLVGDPKKPIKKVAIIGGDGNKFIHQVKQRGADALITGDVYYHTAHDALGIDLSLIDPGHHIEQVMKVGLQDVLIQQVNARKLQAEVITSDVTTEPFQFI